MRSAVAAGVLLGLVLCGSATAEPANPIRFPGMTELASKIAGHPADLLCETREDWDADPLVARSAFGRATSGYASLHDNGTSFAVLRYDICGGAVLALADPNERRIHGDSLHRYTELRVYGLLALIHESNHLIGGGLDLDEGAVECRAIRSFRAIALSIGADRKHADALYKIALAYHLQMPPAFRTVC